MSEDYRNVMARRAPEHWWAVGMRSISKAMVEPCYGRVLDVGCGADWLLRELEGAAQRVGVDIALGAGARSTRPNVTLIRADAARLPFVKGTFELALALDILEQRSVLPAQLLSEIHRVLVPGGRLLIRVPAHPWLYGPHDRFWGGRLRFRRNDLCALVENSGLTIKRITYADTILFPLAVASRLLARAGWGGGNDLVTLPDALNDLLIALLRLEAAWLRRHSLPYGLSLFCLAERQDEL